MKTHFCVRMLVSCFVFFPPHLIADETALSEAENQPSVSNEQSASIQWYKNFTEAEMAAKAAHKPLLLYFTGSDWSGWCQKLNSEVLSQENFVRQVSDKFIFVEIDTPIKKKVPPGIVKQNEELKRKFGVNGYPTVVVLDEEQRRIGVLTYDPTGADNYAKQLLSFIQQAKVLEDHIANCDLAQLSAAELEKLYCEAKEMDRIVYAEQILEAGLRHTNSTFFWGEKYRQLIEKGRGKEPETLAMRQELLKRDSDNRDGRQLLVAVLDFQEAARDISAKGNPHEVIKPLTEFLVKFGKSDDNNRWRVEMTVAQYLFSRGYSEEAVQHAEEGYKAAPESFKLEIRKFIDYIKS